MSEFHKPVTCGCDAPHYALGLCKRHWERHRYHATHIRKRRLGKNPSECSVSGCLFAFHAKGLCHLHYYEQRRRIRGIPPRAPYYQNPLVPQIEKLALTMTQSQIAKFLNIGRMIVIGVVDRARKMGRLPDPKIKVVARNIFPPAGCCLWMDGDPRDPNAFFCGAPGFKKSWCYDHYWRVYRPLVVNTPSLAQNHALEDAAAAD